MTDLRSATAAVGELRQPDPLRHGRPSEAGLTHDGLSAVTGRAQPLDQVELGQLRGAPLLYPPVLLFEVDNE
jgi:hypothetical protein